MHKSQRPSFTQRVIGLGWNPPIRDDVVRMDDMNGTNWTIFGSQGSQVNQFFAPSGIAIDAFDRIYVFDTVNQRLVRVDDMDGTNWTSLGTANGTTFFTYPRSVFVR